MNQSELHQTINATPGKVWETLFSQYGDIHLHNPTMTASSYLGDASEGAPGVARHCEFGKEGVPRRRDHRCPFARLPDQTYWSVLPLPM